MTAVMIGLLSLSLTPLIITRDDGVLVQKKAWRDTYLIERGKMRKQLIDNDVDSMTENFLPIYFTRSGSIENKCEKARYQYPCRPKQVS